MHQSGLLLAGPVAAILLECKALLAALIPPRRPAITDGVSGKAVSHEDV